MWALIADDDPVYRELVNDLLTGWGFETVVVGDGEQAEKIIRDDERIEIAVLDWMMPVMDGYEVCRRMKQSDAGRDVYVIIITGDRLRDELIKVLIAGADDYVIKPFEPLDLKIRLRAAQNIIGLRKQLEELRRTIDHGKAGKVA